MSHLLTKSQENINAAKFLIGKKYFASSIHCSYYSCLQLMKYIIVEKLEIDIAEIENGTKGESSHEWIINKIFQEFFTKRSWEVAMSFKSDVDSLKKLRIKADYYDKLIAERDSRTGFEKADETLKLIKLNFLT